MDNKGTVTRFLKHKDERHKKQWRKPDWDVWEAIRELNTSRTTLAWVRGRPERRKQPPGYNNAETRNVAMDLAAELHYNDEDTDRLWEKHSGPVAIDGHPLTSGIKGALERNIRTRTTMQFLAKRCAHAGDARMLDTGIMAAVKSAEREQAC